MRLLVTRPEPDGERTAQSLRARGHDVRLAPLMRMEAVDFALADEDYCAVVMTSANAARAAGFGDVTSAGGDKSDLVRLLGERLPRDTRPLLYLAGEDRSGDLALAGVAVHTLVAYRAVAVERFPPEVAAGLAQGEFDGVLHFSRRSAQAYVDCASRAGLLDRALAAWHFCLSRQVSEPLAAGAATIRIARRPEEAALIELVGR